MRSPADRRAIRRQDRGRGQVHVLAGVEPGRPQARGHHLPHVEAPAHRRAVGDLQLGGHALHGFRIHGGRRPLLRDCQKSDRRLRLLRGRL